MRDYSNYHNIDTKAKFLHDGELVFDIALDGLEGYDVQINGVDKRVLIQSRFRSDDNKQVYILSKVGEVKIGDEVFHNSHNWLCVSFPETLQVYEKTIIELCNNTLSIVTETPGEIIGRDNLGRPVYSDPTTTTTDIPCVVKSIKEMYNGEDEQINIVSGSIALMVPSNKSDILTQNTKFKMFNNTYEIYGFDYSKTINNKGLVIVLANKI